MPLSLRALFAPPAGVRLTVDRYLCDGPRFVKWRRSHRQKRINKKWHKKYGAIYAKCPGKCYHVRGIGVVCCPCVEAALRKELK